MQLGRLIPSYRLAVMLAVNNITALVTVLFTEVGLTPEARVLSRELSELNLMLIA